MTPALWMDFRAIEAQCTYADVLEAEASFAEDAGRAGHVPVAGAPARGTGVDAARLMEVYEASHPRAGHSQAKARRNPV